MESHKIKSVNTDKRVKNRFRFASSKQRAKSASADVYRSYKRRLGTAASREERVHHPHREETSWPPKKRQRRTSTNNNNGGGQTAVVVVRSSGGKEDKQATSALVEKMDWDNDNDTPEAASFSEELDLAMDRNASEIFGKFHREIWPLVRSLPEVLHHSSKIMDILMAYLLSNANEPEEKSTSSNGSPTTTTSQTTNKRDRLVINHATTDILHLLGVLARDLRHEIHPYLHTQIIPKIVYDLLNPPPTTTTTTTTTSSNEEELAVEKQVIPLDVSIIEAAFRTLSYIFRYDTDALIHEVLEEEETRPGTTTSSSSETPCLEPLRKYYGSTLAHRRDVVRRLAAETFAPLVRKLKSDSARRRHLRRVIQAFSVSQQSVTSSSSALKLQANAVDGISQFFFEVARGVAGQLNSKGRVAAKVLFDFLCNDAADKDNNLPSTTSATSTAKKELVHLVASSFVEKICQHLDRNYYGDFLDDISNVTQRVLKTAVEDKAAESLASSGNVGGNFGSQLHMIRLLDQLTQFREGFLLNGHNDEYKFKSRGELMKTIIHVLDVMVPLFSKLLQNVKTALLSLLCNTWKAIPDNKKFVTQVRGHVESIVHCHPDEQLLHTEGPEKVRHPAHVLAEDVMPYLPTSVAMNTVGTSILSAAADLAESNLDLSLSLILAVKKINSVNPESENEDEEREDVLVSLENAVECCVSSEVKEQLLKICMLDYNAKKASPLQVSQLGVAARCVSFLAVAVVKEEEEDEEEEDNKLNLNTCFKKVAKWLVQVFLDCCEAAERDQTKGDNVVISACLALESLSRLSMETSRRVGNDAAVEKLLSRVKSDVERLLLSHSSFLWSLKSASVYVEALQLFDTTLGERDAIFDAVVPNLRSPSHFRRLYSLLILRSFPKMPFVTDHADLDLADDLDEEADGIQRDEKAMGAVVRTGLCDILETLVSIETTPVKLESERLLHSLISRVEILGRTARLPVLYTEATANHMLGILYIKFAPVWKVAVRAFVALANNQAAFIWSPLLEQISMLINRLPTGDDTPQIEGQAESSTPESVRHQIMCSAWDSSNGEDLSVFGREISQRLPTDEATVLESVLSMLEGAQQLLMKHNREFVPVFLKFLHSQYYSHYQHDPDARELRIEEHIEDTTRVERHFLQPHILKRRLASMLKVFAAVKGPKQLYKHELLLSIFTALLSVQDTSVSQLALSCVQTFKLPYVTPFAERFDHLFAKGGLKEGLLKFTSSLEFVQLDRENKQRLTPILMRVLFGRLSARSGSRSSKDSPAARRAAILSFISTFCCNENELYPFIYLMIRSYVPRGIILQPMESQKDGAREQVLEEVKAVTVIDLESLPVQVHIGFLHLLEPVIAQLGHRAANFIDQIISIVVTLGKMAQIKHGSEESESDDPEEETREEDGGKGTIKEYGSIRTLCFRRLSEIFNQFSETLDFSSHAPALWDSIKHSVDMLPATVVNCGKAPALLSLMVTLSSRQKLIPILFEYKEAVPCVIKCLADTSPNSVVDATLTFIDQLLLDATSENPENGLSLIGGQVDLILHQFTLRLGKKNSPEKPERAELNGVEKPNAKRQVRSTTWRRELDILCRLSNLIETDGGVTFVVDGENGVAEKLCALLIPFLDSSKGATEVDQLNVLKILDVLVPKIGIKAGFMHFEQFAQLLGPSKGRPGISSIPVRQAIAGVILKIAEHSNLAARRISFVVDMLCKQHRKRVDEMDYDSVISALSNLTDEKSEGSWHSLAKLVQDSTDECDTKLLSPIVFICFQFLFDDDGVASRSAFKALKMLIALAAAEFRFQRDLSDDEESTGDQWLLLLERCIVPIVRSGLSARDTSARRFFILLVAEIARFCKDSSEPNLYGDLSALIRDDDPDLDFFLNITHVQMHRRTRAFQRLRKMLSPGPEGDTETRFTPQSLSNVLLPIALNPIYESKSKAEESFAIEAVATVGAISRHLSWSKYNNLLWTNLSQFHRHPEQERYLIAMICAIIDGFHFELSSIADTDTDNVTEAGGGNAVWRALERRFIPKIESLLTKEKVDKNGSKVKSLRASVVLALVKLFKKFSKEKFERKLPRLLTVICGGLKSRDSDSRDVARETLAKVVLEIDIAYLPDVLRELAIALHEGFRLHVRIATIHSILLSLSSHYKPPGDCSDEEAANLPFDLSVPAFMDLIQQDLFGNAQERRDAEGVQGRYVKEAAGSKSHNAMELIASLILFRPSLARVGGKSGIHALVSPLLERLRMPDVDTATIRRVKECLSRIVTGVARNPTVKLEEVLPFVHATAAPFVGRKDIGALFELHGDEEVNSDDEEAEKPLAVSGSKATGVAKKQQSERRDGKVAHWRPSSLNASKTNKDATSASSKEKQKLRRVQDGAAAPKLTGSSRFAAVVTAASRINEPSSIGAVVFSLRLLYSVLKKKKPKSSDTDIIAFIDPFVPLLTACVCGSRETDIMLLSLRCLGLFLYLDLPSKEKCSPALSSKTLDILGSSGVGSNGESEVTQTCFKMLTILMNIGLSQPKGNGDGSLIADGEQALSKNTTMPLDAEQMKVLISFLQEAITDSESHNSALNLLKAIMSRRFVSPEFYDLMETMIEQSVRSHNAALRQTSTGIVINYLLNYPMGPERFEQHLKQIIVNIKYDREDGRLSAINLITMVADKLPLPELEKHVQLFFLPLTLQLVNDNSQKCREAVATCLTKLLSRVSVDVLQSLYDFACRWSQGDEQVQRCSLQLFGFFVDARPDYMKRGDTAPELLQRLQDILIDSSIEEAEWETFYFSLLCLEKLSKAFPKLLPGCTELWKVIIKCLAHPHPFVKLVSSRLINQHLESLDPLSFAEKKSKSKTFLVETSGSLYEIARNLCFQLTVDEEQQSDDIVAICIKSLCWLLPAMKKYPELCISEDDRGGQGDDDEDGNNNKTTTDNPVRWVMKRLSSIAKPKGPKRRQAVFKTFAAFATKCPDVALEHMELMLEPLHRVDIETVHNVEKPSLASQSRGKIRSDTAEGIPEEAVMAREVLHLLEEASDPPDEFLRAYAVVKTRARDRRESRKLLIQSEAIRDPQAAAKRRQENNENKKQRRKRRVEDRRRERGATAKRSRYVG